MTTVTVRPIRDDLSFGARVGGVTLDQVGDPEVRGHLNEAFEEHGLLIFEGVDPTPKMQVAISTVFGLSRRACATRVAAAARPRGAAWCVK